MKNFCDSTTDYDTRAPLERGMQALTDNTHEIYRYLVRGTWTQCVSISRVVLK